MHLRLEVLTKNSILGIIIDTGGVPGHRKYMGAHYW